MTELERLQIIKSVLNQQIKVTTGRGKKTVTKLKFKYNSKEDDSFHLRSHHTTQQTHEKY